MSIYWIERLLEGDMAALAYSYQERVHMYIRGAFKQFLESRKNRGHVINQEIQKIRSEYPIV